MKGLNMLVWLMQLGLSVVMPPVGFTWLALYLRERFDLGLWVLFVGLAIGFISAVDGFRYSLKAMEMMDKRNQRSQKKASESRERKGR